jgi:prevent-host-death family protein
MNIRRDIQTLSEFKQNASKVVKQVQETKQPVVLTVNGKPAAVVQDVDTFQRMAGDSEYWETVKVLKERIQYIRNGGKLIPAEEVFEKLSKKLGIQFEPESKK